MEKEMDSIKLIEPSFFYSVYVFWINKEMPGHSAKSTWDRNWISWKSEHSWPQTTKQTKRKNALNFWRIDCKHNFIIIVVVSGESFYEIIKINYGFIHSCFERWCTEAMAFFVASIKASVDIKWKQEQFQIWLKVKQKQKPPKFVRIQLFCRFSNWKIGWLWSVRTDPIVNFHRFKSQFRFLWMVGIRETKILNETGIGVRQWHSYTVFAADNGQRTEFRSANIFHFDYTVRLRTARPEADISAGWFGLVWFGVCGFFVSLFFVQEVSRQTEYVSTWPLKYGTRIVSRHRVRFPFFSLFSHPISPQYLYNTCIGAKKSVRSESKWAACKCKLGVKQKNCSKYKQQQQLWNTLEWSSDGAHNHTSTKSWPLQGNTSTTDRVVSRMFSLLHWIAAMVKS